MGKPAARIGDMHVCPMVTPGVPPIPHVGGPVVGPGCPTVLIGGMPAAVMGDMCTCVGPPDTIILGSVGVMIGGKPAARMGDMCAHGGTIVAGLPTVLIGEVMPASGGGGAVGSGGGVSGAVGYGESSYNYIQSNAMDAVPDKSRPLVALKFALVRASSNGDAFVKDPEDCEVCAKKSK